MKKVGIHLIESLAEGLSDFYPLPDITPIQKTINRLYIKLRCCGMPSKQVSEEINKILEKHHITKQRVLFIPKK